MAALAGAWLLTYTGHRRASINGVMAVVDTEGDDPAAAWGFKLGESGARPALLERAFTFPAPATPRRLILHYLAGTGNLIPGCHGVTRSGLGPDSERGAMAAPPVHSADVRALLTVQAEAPARAFADLHAWH
jgi:hypothetical protein